MYNPSEFFLSSTGTSIFIRSSRRLKEKKISFATRYHWRPARCGEPARPPVPIACNTKERRTDHNTNECRVNQHGDRQRKSDHLDHQEISEGECRKYYDHDRGGAGDQA